MNKKMTGLIMGGLLSISVLGVTFVPHISSAAEKVAPPMQGMAMEKGQMCKMDMKEMMNSSEMQKHCLEMMKSPEMQAMMKNMMKSPEMQAMMKQMLSSDPAMRQMMLDLVNSIDPNAETATPDSTPVATPPMDHNMHH